MSMTYSRMNLFYASQWKSGELFRVMPFSSKFHNDDSDCITLYILQIHCSDIELCRLAICHDPKSPLNSPHDRVKHKWKVIYQGQHGDRGKRIFQKAAKKYERNKPGKKKPKAALAHTHICSMTSFRYTPSTSATYSSRLVPFPPASGPNVFTWNRTSSSTVTPTPPLSPAARLFSNNEQIKPGTCEGKMNAYPGDKGARHELLQKGGEDLVLHFTKKWLTSMQLLWCKK